MYSIICVDGTVLYDQNDQNTFFIPEPICDMELGQPGKLTFSLMPTHPYYSRVDVMETYLTGYDGNDEVFYGRVIDIDDNRLTGERKVTCAGALEFLEDAELAPLGGEDNSVTESGSAFLARCINAYNDGIGNDTKRRLTLGTINHSRASAVQKFSNGSYSQINSVLTSNLINNSNYGGYLVIRATENGHVVDWIEEYTTLSSSPIQIGVNVEEHSNAITANDFYTVVRPTGKEGLTLPEGTVNVSDELVSKYGRIIRSVSFTDAATETELRDCTTQFISWQAMGLGKTATIKAVDMSFLDNSYSRIVVGSAYNNIDGISGEILVVTGISMHFANPADNTLTLKNKRDMSSSRGGSGGGTGVASSKGTASKVFANLYNHITETQDTLGIHAKYIELNGQYIKETAQEFERFSYETSSRLNEHADNIGQLYGTGVIQNSDHIVQAAGIFSTKYYIVPESRKRPGINPHNCGWYEHYNDTFKEEYYDTGIELYWTINEALQGHPVNTSKNADPPAVVGSWCVKMLVTSDTSVVAGKTYYSKSLQVSNGTSLDITWEGEELTVGEQLNWQSTTINGVVTEIATIQGSALWTHRDSITGVVGEFEVRTNETTGERYIVVKSGGGMKIEESGVEYGLYHDGNLTGGIIAWKINEQTGASAVRIKGQLVDISADLVKVGSTSNVAAWMSESDTWKDNTDETLQDYAGLIADRATIAQLNAQKARIDNLEVDAITANTLASAIASLNSVSITGAMTVSGNATFSGSVSSQNAIYADDFRSTGNSMSLASSLQNVQIISDGANGYKLQKKTNTGSWEDAGTFSRATSLSGAWSGGLFSVTASPQGTSVSTRIVQGTESWNGNTVTIPITAIYFDSGGGSLNMNTGKDVVLSGVSQGVYSSVTAKPIILTGGDLYYKAGSAQTLYEAGTETKTASGDSVTAYPTVSSGGTIYYQAASAVTKYNAGTTTKTARGDAVNAYPYVSSGGTVYYTAGTAVTKYNAGTTTKTARGDSVTAKPIVSSGGTVYYKSGGTVNQTNLGPYSPVAGPGAFYNASGKFVANGYIYQTGATLYTSGGQVTIIDSDSGIRLGDSATYYKGNGGDFTVQGSSTSITPISSTSIRVGALTTYYKGNGGDFTVQGTSTSITPISSTTAIRLGSSGTYYMGNGGDFTVQGDSISVTPISGNGIRLGDAESLYRRTT